MRELITLIVMYMVASSLYATFLYCDIIKIQKEKVLGW